MNIFKPYSKESFNANGIPAQECRPFVMPDRTMFSAMYAGTDIIVFGKGTDRKTYSVRHKFMNTDKTFFSIYGSYTLDDALKNIPIGATVTICRLGKKQTPKREIDNYFVRVLNFTPAPKPAQENNGTVDNDEIPF